MKVYISGPMACRPKTYKKYFNKAQEAFERHGCTVLNPAVLPNGLAHDKYMPMCLAMIDAADMVFMLAGWEKSAGARLERNYAKYQGKVIMYHK